MSYPKGLRSGEWALLEAHLPGQPSQRIGLVLRDNACNALWVKIRPHWWTAGEEAEIWSELPTDLESIASDLGAAEALDWLENTASHNIRLADRETLTFSDPEGTLEQLYTQQIGESSSGASNESNTLAISHLWTGLGAFTAAGWLLAVASTGFITVQYIQSHHPSQSAPISAQTARQVQAADPPLPPNLSEAFPPRLLDATFFANPFPEGCQTAVPHRSPQRHKSFHLDVKSNVKATLLARKLALPLSPSVPDATQIPASTVSLSLPTAPEFRPQHRFIHGLITPLKMVAFFVVGRENSAPSNFRKDD